MLREVGLHFMFKSFDFSHYQIASSVFSKNKIQHTLFGRLDHFIAEHLSFRFFEERHNISRLKLFKLFLQGQFSFLPSRFISLTLFNRFRVNLIVLRFRQQIIINFRSSINKNLHIFRLDIFLLLIHLDEFHECFEHGSTE